MYSDEMHSIEVLEQEALAAPEHGAGPKIKKLQEEINMWEEMIVLAQNQGPDNATAVATAQIYHGTIMPTSTQSLH